MFRIRKVYWIFKLRKLTINDKLNMDVLFDPLTVLPKRFNSKEFLINSIKQHNITHYQTFSDLLNIIGIKPDYDIAVTFELNRLANHYKRYTYNGLVNAYSEYLTKDEINKIYTVLELMK